MKEIDNIMHQTLFRDPELSVYAVLDGAAIPNLINQLKQHQAEYICLYQGQLDPNLAAVAPYLLALPANAQITHWLIDNIGKHPGIFATSTASIRDMRKHFRSLLMGYNAENNPIYIRYYDPRLLGAFLATFTNEDHQEFFGPVSSYYAENRMGDQLKCFSAENLPKPNPTIKQITARESHNEN